MKTIDDILNEANGETRIVKEVRRDNRIEACYKQFPELKAIDVKLVEMRRGRFMASIEHNDSMEEAYTVKEAEMLIKRDEYIRSHGIDPAFDELKDICDKCHDTGYKLNAKGRKIVCDCRQRELEECYIMAGMADYSTYTPKKYNKTFGKDPARRNAVLSKMMKICSGEKTGALFLYSGEGGSGKTYLSVCVVKAAITMGKSAVFCRGEEVADLSDDEISYYKNCDLLLVDDFSGEITLKRSVGATLNEILESRGATSKPTVIVSMEEKNSLISSSDVRIASKLQHAEVL